MATETGDKEFVDDKRDAVNRSLGFINEYLRRLGAQVERNDLRSARVSLAEIRARVDAITHELCAVAQDPRNPTTWSETCTCGWTGTRGDMLAESGAKGVLKCPTCGSSYPDNHKEK